MVACLGHLYFPGADMYVSGVVTDLSNSKVATGLWNSFRFWNAPISCLSKKPASCNPNEGGDTELPRYWVQTKWMLSNFKRTELLLNTGMLLVSTSHLIVKRCLTCCLNTLVFMIVKIMFWIIQHNTFIVPLLMMFFTMIKRNREVQAKQDTVFP